MNNENLHETPELEPVVISEQEAIELAIEASKWLEETFKIPTDDFFRSADKSTFKGEDVRIFSRRPVNSEFVETNIHFWVYQSPQTRLELDPNSPYEYFSNYIEALNKHIQNLLDKKDSFVRGAGGASEGSKSITGGLFEIYLAYGLMTVLHEPFHPWVIKLLEDHGLDANYYINEGLTSYLGLEVLELFAIHVEEKYPEVAKGIRMYGEVNDISLKFFYLAYFILEESYEKLPKEQTERDVESQRIMDEMNSYALKLNTAEEVDTIRVNEINNARIVAGFTYSSFMYPVQKYFEDNSLSPIEFILNPELQKEHIVPLFDFVTSNLNKKPENLSEEWEAIKKTLDTGKGSQSLTK